MTPQEMYDHLVETVKSYNPSAGFDQIHAAYEYAAAGRHVAIVDEHSFGRARGRNAARVVSARGLHHAHEHLRAGPEDRRTGRVAGELCRHGERATRYSLGELDGLAFGYGHHRARGKPQFILHMRGGAGSLGTGEEHEIAHAVSPHFGRAQGDGVRSFYEVSSQQTKSDVFGLVCGPGARIGTREQNAYRVRLGGHPLLMSAVEFTHLSNGHSRIGVIAENDQGIFGGGGKGYGGIEENPGGDSGSGSDGRSRNNGLGQH